MCHSSGELQEDTLRILRITFSKLTSLKITHSEITDLETSNYDNLDNIMSLDLSFNQLQSLNVSRFIMLENLNIVGNSNLDCIVVNQNQLSSIPTTWIKESATEYNIDCK